MSWVVDRFSVLLPPEPRSSSTIDGRVRRRAAAEINASANSTHRGEVLKGCGDRSGRQRCQIDRAQAVHAVFHVAADETLRRIEGKGRHPEIPLRAAEFGRERIDRLDRVAARAEQVPPAAVEPVLGAVGDEIEGAVGRPFRLEDRLVIAAGDPPFALDRAVVADLADPQLAADPRHARMVPFEPGEPAQVRAEARRGIEIPAGLQDALRLG